MSPDITSATPRIARAINNRLVLDLLLRHGPLTAAQLRKITGMSRATIADVLQRLQEDGLIEVRSASTAVQPGPHARLYELSAGRAHVVGVDARTDSVSIGVADLAGNRLPDTGLPIGKDEPGTFVARVAEAVRRISRETFDQEPNTIAVGAPGVVEPGTGALRSTGWPPEWHADLVTALKADFTSRVLVENEVNLAAIAEHRLGAARDRADFALLWLGHGVGAGLILDGRLRRGESGGAGEVGFLAVPDRGTAVPAAERPGLHGLVGAAPIRAMAGRHGLPVPEGTAVHAATAAVAAAVQGTRGGEPFLGELADIIADGVLALCLVLDPGCVVLGGEVGRAGGAELADRVGAALARRSPIPVRIRVSDLADSPVLAGAVVMALDHAHDDLFGTRQ
ncbi:ROK family transcriptional regulator [Sphaerisporangium sp. NPDC005288]|uniref:ROK family transcriptional regulator n=1 Tax=Sphaerisporangium sp. NPDC005288 TaxID=3155114 RepID=UPI0033A56D3F